MVVARITNPQAHCLLSATAPLGTLVTGCSAQECLKITAKEYLTHTRTHLYTNIKNNYGFLNLSLKQKYKEKIIFLCQGTSQHAVPLLKPHLKNMHIDIHLHNSSEEFLDFYLTNEISFL